MRFARSGTIAGLAVALSTASASAIAAESAMPQMDFADPLTLAQVVWMAVIMIVLYILMARWALPQLGGVIENRKRHIDGDLEAATQARTEASRIVAEVEQAIRNAHSEGQAAIASAIVGAKDNVRIEEEALKGRLDAELNRAKGEIEQTRRAALAVLRPVADDVARALVERLTGCPAERTTIAQALDAAQR